MKTTTLRLLSGFVLVLFAVPPLQAETKRVEGLEFSRVTVIGDVEVEIRQGDANELQLRGDADDLAEQPFYVAGDTLVLGANASRPETGLEGIKYKLTARELRYLKLAGSGQVYMKPMQLDQANLVVEGSGDVKAFELEGREITLAVSGSGDLQAASVVTRSLSLVMSGSGDIHVGKLQAEEVEVALRGSGDIGLEEPGTAERIEVNIAGSGDVDLSLLAAPLAEVNIVGSGTGHVGEVESLEVNILGSGDVYYRGEPRVERSVFGSGELHQSR